MWRSVFHKQPADAELEEELQAHLAIETKELMDNGKPRDLAEAEARRHLGNQTQIIEGMREVWGWAGLFRLWQDLRYGLRVLFREPAFAITTVLSLALGIAATTVVFSIADLVFLRPLPYTNAGQLVWVGVTFPSIHGEFLPSPDYVAWRRDNRVFQQLAAAQRSLGNVMVLRGSDPSEVRVVRVSANFLDTFAITPILGRSFTAEEELPTGPKAVVLTNQFWREHFDGRSDIVGSTITLDSQLYAIVGVLPPSFAFPADARIDLLTTLPVSPAANHHDRNMSTWAVYGRLKPGVTVAQARADGNILFAASKAAAPGLFQGDNKLVVEPLQDHRSSNTQALIFVLAGAVSVLLAIACANVANLLFARWSARTHELAVRAATGASRGRLARQLFTEVALLIGLSTVLAMILVIVALNGVRHFANLALPRLSEIEVDFRVFAIALLVSCATALVFGALPVLQAGRIDLHSVLQQSSRGSTSIEHRIARRGLVAIEIALSVVLVSGAGLLLETLWYMQNDHLGFRPEHALTVSIPLEGSSFENSAREPLASHLLAYLRRMPGTEAAALTQCTPLVGGVSLLTFSRSDRPLPEPFHHGDSIGVCSVGPDYLKASGTHLLQGRFFADDDVEPAGTIAVINETAARAYFPGERAIGKQILGGRAATWKTVVGVIGDTKNQGLNQPAAPEALLNDAIPRNSSDLVFLVRTLASEDFVAQALRDELQANYAGLFAKTETLDHAIGESSTTARFNAILLCTFGALAFVISLVGIYGVLAFSVAQRRKEIGIRMGLGATPNAAITLVMKEGAVLVAWGVFAGIAGAMVLTRFLATMLYGVRPNDPATYAAVIVGVVTTACVAVYLPARKAGTLDPVMALRDE